jgi:hypothetical protein
MKDTVNSSGTAFHILNSVAQKQESFSVDVTDLSRECLTSKEEL